MSSQLLLFKMKTIVVLIISSFMLANLPLTVESSCVFPDHLQNGTWRSTRWDDIVFTVDEMTVPDFDGDPLTFACDTRDGSQYLIRSTITKFILTVDVDVVACLEFSTTTTGVKVIYYHATNERALGGGVYQPVRVWSPPGASMTFSDICTDTTYEAGSNDVMINVATAISEAAIQCPLPLLANFDDYTVTDSGTPYCNGVGYIHICDDKRTVLVEYSVCNKEIFYSSNGNLSCVHYTSSGSTYYVNLLNSEDSVDNSNTYHYTCLAVQKSGGVWYASQWPRKCSTDQTPTSVSSNIGYTFVMNANLTCGPSSSSGAFNIIPIVVSIVLVLIIGGLIYYFGIKKKGCKKMKKKLFNKEKKTKKSQVDPTTSADISVSAAPMDGHKTGLQATAVIGYPSDRSQTITPFERRNLETAQSTRSAITVSHMDAELVEDSTPRRLPPLMPHPPNQPENGDISDTSDTPSIPPRQDMVPPARLPPISEQVGGGGGGGGGEGGGGAAGDFNASSVSTSAVNATTISKQ